MSSNPLRGALLGGLTPAQFLKRYWQKRPLCIRGAFPNFQDPVTRDELAGLSCERDVASRLVMERGGTKPWQVINGPQRAAQLKKLPKSHWTLLVQGVDRLIPGVAALLESFRFIPDWRVDDVMISFAPRAGTVGPHRDNYDVFLLQGQGRRRWRVDSRAGKALRTGFDLRLLKKFSAEQEWILEPGDMLYLPPGLAHYGVALEECLTYSIGFRAPSEMDLLAALQQRLSAADATPLFYSDPDLRPSPHAGELATSALQALRRLLEQRLKRMDDRTFGEMIGEFLTEPKSDVPSDMPPMTAAALRARFIQGRSLVRRPGSRLMFLNQQGITQFFVNGMFFPLTRKLAFAAPLFTQKQRLTFSDLRPYLKRSDFLALVLHVMQAGAFVLER